ncbi:MAG: 30S ribosomal protein S18 [Chloroflexi bacterium]|nr:30S ribosomal protein S18 [Chloroflexota bacterium]
MRRDTRRREETFREEAGLGKEFEVRRRRVCPFCAQKVKDIDYKQADMLRQFITDRGKIKTRRKTAVCARHQRRLAVAIKRARFLALLPYTPELARGS